MLNPDPCNVMKWRLEHRLWDVLGYEHDGLHDEAEKAKQRAAADADRLRAFWAKYPHRAPGDAESVIASAWRDAKAKFGKDLSDEHLCRPVPPWRKERGVEGVYV